MARDLSDMAGLGADQKVARFECVALPGIPEVMPGHDLTGLILDGIARAGMHVQTGDVIVIAQKIVSKAEGKTVDLTRIAPSEKALALAQVTQKDSRLVELILRESKDVLRAVAGVLIVEHRLGHVMANAGIDQSNVPGEDVALLLPEDPDATCVDIRDCIHAETGADVAVLINDSHGRAWRNGTMGVALGVSGIAALDDRCGGYDRDGRELVATQIGLADEISATASLLMGQTDEGRPVVLIRGIPGVPGKGAASDLLRPRERDLFR